MPHSVRGNIKIAVIGAGGGIGQPLSLLLKTQLAREIPNHLHTELALYDVNADAVKGVAVDLSHVDTGISVRGYYGDGIGEALQGADIILVPAGVPRKPGMTRESLLTVNAKIVKSVGSAIGRYCDLNKTFILLISNPVNSLVPVLVKELESISGSVGKHVLGVTTLDSVRASTFLHEAVKSDSNTVNPVAVIGGHSGETIVPVFSQAPNGAHLSEGTLEGLVHRVRFAGDEVVKAKNGLGSATLSMAHAAYRVTASFIPLVTGEKPYISGTFYVSLKDNDGNPINDSARRLLGLIGNLPFFAIPLQVTPQGIGELNTSVVENLNKYEKEKLLPPCLTKLKGNIAKGLEA